MTPVPAVAMAAALLLTLAGCGSGDTGQASPAAPSSAIAGGTPSTPPTSTLTTPAFDVLANMPPEAKQNTVEGRAAFARYFFEQASIRNLDPKPGELSKLCTTQQTFCTNLDKESQSLVDAKLHGSGKDIIFNHADPLGAPGIKDANNVIVMTYFEQLPTRKLDSTGGDHGELSSHRDFAVEIELKWATDHWALDAAREIYGRLRTQ